MSNLPLISPRFVKIISPLALAIALAACGGGGSSFGTDTGTGGTPDTGGERPELAEAVSSIDIQADSLQLLSDGSKPIIIKAIAKNEKNIAISDASFEFSVDNDATLVVNGDSATLTPGGAVEGNDLTITVTSGEQTKTIIVKVIKKEEQVEGGEVVDSIDLRYETKQLLADGSRPIILTAIAKNKDKVAISADVKFSATGNVTLEVSGNSVTISSDGAEAGETITVTAQSGNQEKTIDLLVIKKEELAESDIKLGSSSGSSFKVGELDILNNQLQPGGNTSIKVYLVDTTNNNELFATDTAISFNSNCIADGTAEISDVSFNAGIATINYQAKGCSGTDTITATAVVNGKTISASSDLTVDAAIVSSISFDAAEPANIGLRGMGLNEVSAVSFVVLDTEGNPVINQVVNFSLSNNLGGAFLTNTTAKTDASGKVIARVHSGTKATTIKVLASVDAANNTTINTESRGLVISTGVADDDSFSISMETLNPEALNFDGVTSNVFVQVADHFNNPVPKDTAVSFTTEAGSITSGCFINDVGTCSVVWTSGGNRPVDGRSTIIASIQGEESFDDANDNSLLDENETFTDVNGDGKYNGLLCEATNPNCSDTKTIKISKEIEVVMSGSSAIIDRPATVEISKNATKTFTIELSDINGQTLSKDTSVSVSIVSAASGEEEPPHTIVSVPTWKIPNTNAGQPAAYSIIVQDGGTGLSSILQIKVTSQNSKRTTVAYVNLVEAGTQQEPELAVAMDLSATAPQILLDGSKPVTITAIVKDENNNVLSGIPVLFTVGDEGTLNVSSNTATLTPASIAVAGDQLIVTATVLKSTGNIIRTIVVDVVDSLEQGQADSLELSASSRQLFSSGTDPIVLSAIVKDKNNNPLPDETVVFSVNNNATISPVNGGGEVKTANLTPGLNHPENRALTVVATVGSISETLQVDVVGTHMNVDGPNSIAINKATEYSFKLLDSADKPIAFKDVVVTSALVSTITPVGGSSLRTDANGELVVSFSAAAGGTDTLTGTAAGASVSKDIDISGNDFTLVSTLSDIDLGTPETITVEWLVDGVPKENETISVRTTRGTLNTPTVTTGTTDPNKGKAVFTVSSNTAGTATITAETASGLTTTLSREFVATTPGFLNAQASPSLISPNKSSTIITKVRDDNDNPVKNVKVNFNLTDTVNGQLSNSQAVTDSLGRAEVVYTAGDSSSALEGVKILTELQDFPAITDQVSLTVGGDALRIVLGSDENLVEEDIFYKKTFGVIVTDSAGNPISDQQVDFTIAATHYNKGYMVPVVGGWSSVIATTCPAEDFDHDGNLDNNEDENNNGTLEPTQAATVTGTGITDAQGKLTVEVVYPQSEAIWTVQRLTATTVVGGTEFVEHTSFRLNLVASDASDPAVLVPNVVFYDEDRNGNGIIDTLSEDLNANGLLDVGEDINNNGQLDLSVSEDLDGNGTLDARYKGAYGYANDCTNPN